MFEVAHHGVAAAQLGGPAVPLVVVADGAVADHGQDEGEDPLVATRGGTDHLDLCTHAVIQYKHFVMFVPQTCSSKIWTHAHDIQRDVCFYRSLLILKCDFFKKKN